MRIENIIGDPSGARVRAFLQWFRNLRQLPAGATKLRFILAGSIGLDNVTRRHQLTDTINDLRLWPLGPFEPAAAHEFLGQLATSYKLDVDPELRTAICDVAEWLIPFHLQVIFSALREHARTSKPTASMLGEVIESLLHRRTYFPTGTNGSAIRSALHPTRSRARCSRSARRHPKAQPRAR